MNKVTDIGIIILAAGSSSRMGSSRQLLQVENQPLLVKTTRTAIDSVIKNIVVVLGANEQPHRRIIDSMPIAVTYNPHWQKGIGNSIKLGLDYHLKNTNPLEGIIILACDQPLLPSSHINSLIETYRLTNKPIIASSYAETVGIPVLFGKQYFPELLALKDNEGAKKIILSSMNEASIVEFQGGAIDLDTPDDYQNYLSHQK